MTTGTATADAAKRVELARRSRAKRKELRSALERTRVNQEELQKPENDDLELAVGEVVLLAGLVAVEE